MEQLLAHLVGDYILQPHKMAVEKTSSWKWALLHGSIYTLPFLLITQSAPALLVIALSHALIDRYRLAKYVAQLKNRSFTGDGYPKETPDWLRVWLMIITDNTMHMVINYFVLRSVS